MATKKKSLKRGGNKARSIERLGYMILRNEFTVQALFQEGVDIETKLPGGNTFLLFAGNYNCRYAVEILLNSGANIDCSNDDGWTPLHFLIKWPDILQAHVKRVRDIDAMNKNRYTALHVAVVQYRPEAVKCLVEAGADVNLRIRHGCSPLMIASSKGKVDVVNMLLYKETCVCDRNKECPVWHKSYRRRVCDIDARDDNGLTALHLASFNGYTEVVKCLLEKGADTDVKDNHGDTALIIACLERHSDIIKYLVEANASCDIIDDLGRSPLYCVICPLLPRPRVVLSTPNQRLRRARIQGVAEGAAAPPEIIEN